MKPSYVPGQRPVDPSSKLARYLQLREEYNERQSMLAMMIVYADRVDDAQAALDAMTWPTPQATYLLASMPYADYLLTDHWQDVRMATLERYGYRCMGCGRTGVALETHHVTYVNRGHEEPNDTIPRCGPCHAGQTDINRRLGLAG